MLLLAVSCHAAVLLFLGFFTVLQKTQTVEVAHHPLVVNQDLLLIVDLAHRSPDLHLLSLILEDPALEVDLILGAIQDLIADILQAAGV